VDGQPCTEGHADLDRSLVEVGLRFFHADDNLTDRVGVALGIEPFVAFIDEDTSSFIGNADPQFFPNGARTSNLDATAYGALFALDGRYHVLERTVLTGRVAAGIYHVDADTDTLYFFGGDPSNGADASISSDFWGIRSQLAVGLEQMLTDTLSVGVIGRLDYWSDYPSMEWTNAGLTGAPRDNSIGDDDFLALSIGARISVAFR
jgi:hypothetical protein